MAKYLQKSSKANYHYIDESGVSVCKRASVEHGYNVIEAPGVPGHRICYQCYSKISNRLYHEIRPAIMDAITSDGAARIYDFKKFVDWQKTILDIDLFPAIDQWNDSDMAIVSQELYQFWTDHR